jgi:hypothetical protein
VAGWDFFALEPAEAPTPFRLVVPTGALFADPALVASRTSVVLAVDLGRVAPDLAGIEAPFLRLPVSIDAVDFERRDGRFVYVGHTGRGAADGLDGLVREIDTRTKVRLHDHGEALSARYGIRVGGYGAEAPAAEYTFSERGVGWCWGSEVFWAQPGTRAQRGVPAPDWCYAGMVQSFMSGCVFGFYRPSTGQLRLIVQTT